MTTMPCDQYEVNKEDITWLRGDTNFIFEC